MVLGKTKRKVTNLSAAALVFRAKNPAEIFLETKDDTHPLKMVRNSLCIIGGNWIGDEAKADRGPLDTLKREWAEELSLRRTKVHGSEMKSLGFGGDGKETVVESRGTEDDAKRLDEIRGVIIDHMAPFGSFKKTITRKAILSADPEAKQQAFTSIVNVWTSPLDERNWFALKGMQEKHGNLLTEFSRSTFTSLDEILKKQTRSAFGYDRTLQSFFGAMGLVRAKELPLVPHIVVEKAGMAFATYDEYLREYDVASRPQ